MVVYNYHSLFRRQSESDGSLSSGESVHGQVAPVKCQWSSCGEWFNSLEDLASHVGHCHAVAGKGGLFYCGWRGCSRGDRGFNARYKMLVHVRTHTNEKPHQCFICDKSFSRAENLKIHARSHTGERPYVCPVEGCGKAYSNSSDRFKHTRTHSIDKPYVCKVPGCPKRYTDPSSLRKHVKTYRHFPANQPTKATIAKTENEWDRCSSISQETNAGWGSQREASSPSSNETTLITPFPLDANQRVTCLPEERSQCGQAQTRGELPFFPSWPGLFHWYLPPHHPQQHLSTGVCYSEQETPLDLTTPIRLQHRI